MRKIRLGFISPYVAMVPLIEELNKGNDDFDIIVQVGNLEAGVNYALAMEKQGIDILISRGGTANLVREAVSVPVIDVHISGYDLLRSIMLANGYSDEKKL
ncbi:PrpR N-terminal domain-containing protein [Planococcus sp. 107-1]|uniref:PrpR N-terminal domain-containing protein n=1 Tax=Planococcus sp. 107-1 TaxID=2908840 RepID=UPI001F26B486|nr:PrpR N-terminal domain-containing protein [Planococcus sp. 107-1]UJF26043.1 PrpR N-terminal domain-containing protein [Planococcus sp. 107-1]